MGWISSWISVRVVCANRFVITSFANRNMPVSEFSDLCSRTAKFAIPLALKQVEFVMYSTWASSSSNFCRIRLDHFCTNNLMSFALSVGIRDIEAAVERALLMSFSSWLTKRTRSFPGSLASNRSTSEVKNERVNFRSSGLHSSTPSMMTYCLGILCKSKSRSCFAGPADVNITSPLA